MLFLHLKPGLFDLTNARPDGGVLLFLERLQALKEQQDTAIRTRIGEIEQSRLQMKEKHVRERAALSGMQEKRWTEETQDRQEWFNIKNPLLFNHAVSSNLC